MNLPEAASKQRKKSFREWLGHAFAVGDYGEPTQRESDAMEALADYIVKRGLEAPAILFLQGSVPVSYIGSQVMVGLEPLLGPFFRRMDYSGLRSFFERRDAIERLTSRIEELISERDA